ncbi:hypothetical protein GCM10022278_36480 [Allohahella marinimesophila]|uniref:Uncharacterized protein n=1 Tax=Allohahella marinimesophila TaxID=1054972 RepID=A0ABP7Q523_9GAMM
MTSFSSKRRNQVTKLTLHGSKIPADNAQNALLFIQIDVMAHSEQAPFRTAQQNPTTRTD